jgi:hypothetical protein
MNELRLNPNLRIRRIVVDGQVTAYSLVAPVKGRGRLQHTLGVADTDPSVVSVLEGLTDADAESDVDADEAAWATLARLGVLVIGNRLRAE